jgi:hypothetical protein
MTTPAASSSEALDTLRQLEDLRDHTRALLRSFWFPLVVFDVLTVLSAPVAAAGDGPIVALYWAVAGSTGGSLVSWYYHAREDRIGVSKSGLPYIATAGVLFVAAFAVGGAYLVFAWLDRSALLAALGVAVAVVPGVALASSLDHPGPVVAAITGVAILVTGLAARRRE